MSTLFKHQKSFVLFSDGIGCRSFFSEYIFLCSMLRLWHSITFGLIGPGIGPSLLWPQIECCWLFLYFCLFWGGGGGPRVMYDRKRKCAHTATAYFHAHLRNFTVATSHRIAVCVCNCVGVQGHTRPYIFAFSIMPPPRGSSNNWPKRTIEGFIFFNIITLVYYFNIECNYERQLNTTLLLFSHELS